MSIFNASPSRFSRPIALHHRIKPFVRTFCADPAASDKHPAAICPILLLLPLLLLVTAAATGILFDPKACVRTLERWRDNLAATASAGGDHFSLMLVVTATVLALLIVGMLLQHARHNQAQGAHRP